MTRTLAVGFALICSHVAHGQYGSCPPRYYVPCPPVMVVPCCPPAAAPAPSKEVPQTMPSVKPAEFVKPAEGAPKPDAPKPAEPVAPPKPPTVDAFPKPPEPKGDSPLTLPKMNLPEAPASKAFEPAVPKLNLPEPSLPKPSDAPKREENLIPLVIPPLPGTPGAKSESKYRPEDAPRFETFPVDGTGPTEAGGKWKVGFYNYAGRELELNVGGSIVKVPAKSYVHAIVPAAFTWKLSGGVEQTTRVPSLSGGVEIVLR